MPRTTRVLEHDRTLLELVPSRTAADACAASIARVIDVRAGTWPAQDEADAARGGIGLLCLEGLQLRRVGMRTSYGAELLGPGDIVRPWQHDGEEAELIAPDTSWRIVAPSSFAVLDIRWAMRMAPWPAVGCELVGRALERSLRLATLMAISQHRRLDVRLRLLLWKLADRFGIVRHDGVHLEIPLTHEALSLLAVARRPSVSTCLRRMAEAGELRQERRHIVLLGEPPGPEELDVQPVDTKTFLSSV
jgi:CRP/FNR family transcriptional regulator, cyclic AMP receptor protein